MVLFPDRYVVQLRYFVAQPVDSIESEADGAVLVVQAFVIAWQRHVLTRQQRGQRGRHERMQRAAI